MNKLNLTEEKEPIHVGFINKELINFLNLSANEAGIVIWKDRIKYIEKHKSDFDSEEEWIKHVEAIPDIIENFDFVGIHPKGDSIQFIKKVDKHMLIGIRISNKKNWAVRSAYPISEIKLQTYIQSGTIKTRDEYINAINNIN